MTNSRAKGARYELDVEKWLTAQPFGFAVSRANRSGYDGEDFTVADLLSVEAKNVAANRIGSWVDQAVTQADASNRLGVVIHKRAGRSDVGEHYVTMRASDFSALLVALEVVRP